MRCDGLVVSVPGTRPRLAVSYFCLRDKKQNVGGLVYSLEQGQVAQVFILALCKKTKLQIFGWDGAGGEGQSINSPLHTKENSLKGKSSTWQ